jgi:hypothetical protein
VAPLLLAFTWAGNDYAWLSPQVSVAFAVSAVVMAAFLIVELRADDPVVPLSIFRNRVFAIAALVTFVSGAAMFAGTVYIPLFMQAVLGFSATNAGLVLTPMTLGIVGGSMISGQVVSRTGRYKWVTVSGLVVACVGLWLLAQLDAGSSQWHGMRDMFLIGFGLGFTIPTLVLAAQNSVSHAMLGVSTSIVTFARSVGGTIGVAIMGSLLTRRLDDELAAGLPAEVQARAPAPLLEALKNPRLLLDEGALDQVRARGFDALFGADAPALFEATVESMREALATSITDVFLLSLGVMVVALAVSVLLPEIPLRTTHEMAPEVEERAAAPAASAPAPAAAGAMIEATRADVRAPEAQ